MLYLCIFHTQNLCRSSKIGGLGNGGCGHSVITPLCHSLLLTVFSSSSVGPSHRPQFFVINLLQFLQVTFLCSTTGSSMAAGWLSVPQAASASGAPPLPPPPLPYLTLVLKGLFLTLFLVPFLPVQRFLPFLNCVFPAVLPVFPGVPPKLMSPGTSIVDLAVSRTGQPLNLSHRGHPCSPLAANPLAQTPHT